MQRESGFTLVELLVVMLILGILAAVAIPSFFIQRDKGRDAQAKVAARTAATAAETIATDNGGTYNGPSGVTVASLEGVEATLQDATLSVVAASATGYTLRVTSDTGNNFDFTRNADGTADLTCTLAGDSGCPPDGTWSGS